MTKQTILAIYCGLLLSFLSLSVQADGDLVLVFDTMQAVSEPFLGSARPVRNLAGDDQPWTLRSGNGELRGNGYLLLKVRGLLLQTPSAQGKNPLAYFRAAVSCITMDEDGWLNVKTVFSQNGPEAMLGDPGRGDANITERLDLPNPCISPIVFITSPDGRWLAAASDFTEKIESKVSI